LSRSQRQHRGEERTKNNRSSPPSVSEKKAQLVDMLHIAIREASPVYFLEIGVTIRNGGTDISIAH
jgi:hypothetical protein